MKKNILFINAESNSANGVCVNNIAECLKERYNVFIITNMTREKHMNNGVSEYYVKPRLYNRLVAKKINNRLAAKAVQKFAWVINKAKLLMSFFSWPLISPLYTFRIYRQEKKLHKKYHFDYIVPVYTLVDGLIATKFLKKKYNDFIYIPYLLDAFSGGYGPSVYSKEHMIKHCLKWEDYLFSNADCVIAMQSSEKHCEKYWKKELLEKTVFLDIPLYKRMNYEHINRNNTLSLLYIGTIPIKIRNPEYFFEVFKSIKNDNLSLTFVGCGDCAAVREYAAKDKRVKILPFVSHSEAISLIKETDICINLGNNAANMVPSKVFEYMSYGKPIISVVPIENEPSTPYLVKYKNACIIKEWETVPVSKNKLLDFLGSFVPNDTADKSDVFYKNTPKAFADVLDGLKQ